MNKQLKTYLEGVLTAMIEQDTTAAKQSFHDYLRLKSQHILMGEAADSADEDEDDKSDDNDADEDKSDKKDDKKDDKKEDKKEDKSDKKDDKKDDM